MGRTELYPLSFTPIYKERVWGGSQLRRALGKDLPGGPTPIGESWELVDLSQDQSVVRLGALAGRTLEGVVRELGTELLGPAALDEQRFPLLVKYIDASQTLSVQVHPDRDVASRLGGRAKSEAWYILDAEPDAALYLGLEPGTTVDDLRAALLGDGGVEQLVTRVPVRRGDLFPVPPGTVHAIGAGILLAEVQQPSDTTYRVYDWGRVGLDGKPRELHVEHALQSIHLDARPAGPVREGVVDMGLFRIEVATLDPEQVRQLGGEGPAVVVGLGGEARVDGGSGTAPCGLGDVVLLPHALRGQGRVDTTSGARVLVVTFPISS